MEERSHPSIPRGKKVSKPVDKPDKITSDPAVRSENEDDDGYDPYSDRREKSSMFERNPWD